jgi:hypothetical protein
MRPRLTGPLRGRRLRLGPIPLRQDRLHGLNRTKWRHPFVGLGANVAVARVRVAIVEGLPVLDVIVLARLTPTPACPGHT